VTADKKIPPPLLGHNWPPQERRAPVAHEPLFKHFQSEPELDDWVAANRGQLDDLERRNAARAEVGRAKSAAWGDVLRRAVAKGTYRLPRSVGPTIEALAQLAQTDRRRPLPTSFGSIARLTAEHTFDYCDTCNQPRCLSEAVVRTAMKTMVACDLLRVVPTNGAGPNAFDHGPAVTK
jgi:hypothetical protein